MFRHSCRSWLDAVGTSIAVQQKMMRHTDTRTTMHTFGDVIMDENERSKHKSSQPCVSTKRNTGKVTASE